MGSPQLLIQHLHLRNFRSFEELLITLDPCLTVIIGDNGSGKSNLLRALATVLAPIYNPAPLTLEALSDVREDGVGKAPVRQGIFPCDLLVSGYVNGQVMNWARTLHGPTNRTTNQEVKEFRARVSDMLGADGAWPIALWYGTSRLWSVARNTPRKRPVAGRREQAWMDALDPRSSEVQLLQWWWDAYLRKTMAEDGGAFDTMTRVLRAAVKPRGRDGEILTVDDVSFDLVEALPILHRSDGSRLRWSQLSAGFHTFCGMVGDITRRLMVLNGGILDDPPRESEGVVLIDELDLHLHPRWQIGVAHALCEAFPKLQFVVTTHSPLVLSSVRNDQVRMLEQGRLVEPPPRVEGRDVNAILREEGAPWQSEEGRAEEEAISNFIHEGDIEQAEQALKALELKRPLDAPELVRLRSWLSWER